MKELVKGRVKGAGEGAREGTGEGAPAETNGLITQIHTNATWTQSG